VATWTSSCSSLQATEWHEAEGAPQGGVYTGVEAILNGVFGPLMQQIADFKVTPHEFLSAAGTACSPSATTPARALAGPRRQICPPLDRARRQGDSLRAVRGHRAAAAGRGSLAATTWQHRQRRGRTLRTDSA
jgi:hypothetical protein